MSENEVVPFHAVEYTQFGYEALVGVISSEGLRKLYSAGVVVVDQYDDSTGAGYQPKPSPTRVEALTNELKSGRTPLLSPIILSARSSMQFSGIRPLGEDRYNVPIGDVVRLHVVDGITRLNAILNLPDAEMGSGFGVPLTILFLERPLQDWKNADYTMEEVRLFILMNQNPSRIEGGLLRRLALDLRQKECGGCIKESEPIRKTDDEINAAVFLALRLRRQSFSPFLGLISVPGKEYSDKPVNFLNLVYSLLPVVGYARQAGFKLGETLEIVTNYWSAIKSLCPRSFEQPRQSLMLGPSNVGLFSLNIMLPMMLIRLRKLGGTSDKPYPTLNQFVYVMRQMSDVFTDDYWDVEHGEAGNYLPVDVFEEFAGYMMDELPEELLNSTA